MARYRTLLPLHAVAVLFLLEVPMGGRLVVLMSCFELLERDREYRETAMKS